MFNKKLLTIDLNHFGTSKGPSQICRDLIGLGFRPETTIEFHRGSTLLFISPKTIGQWANLFVREAEGGRPMRFTRRTQAT